MKTLWGSLSLASAAVCLAAPVLFFLGRATEGAYKGAFLAGSIGWFVFAVLWAGARKRVRAGSGPAAR